MSDADRKLEGLRRQAEKALNELAASFSRPGETKLTLIIRCPWLGDGDTVFTDDTRVGIDGALDRHVPKLMDVESIPSDGGTA